MAINNHLRNKAAQRKVLTVAFGRHIAEGHLLWSYLNESPNQVYCFNRLGEGRWNALEAVWWRGFGLAPSEFHFHPGTKSTGFDDPIQGVDEWFPKDVPHSRTATLAYRTPVDEMDTSNLITNPPLGLSVLAQTKWCPDFNEDGETIGEGYSVNPANEIVEILLSYARMPNLPAVYSTIAQYWLSRIDWANWTEFRDFHNQTETVDYTALEDQEGFGLTGRYYNGNNFDTFLTERIDPIIDLPSSSGSATYGQNSSNFSIRWEGKFKSKSAGEYTFSCYHDDGVKVWVNGTLIIDQWGTAATHTGTITLAANTFYSIKVEFKGEAAPNGITLSWTPPAESSSVISAKYLYPKEVEKPLYEVHTFFDTPISPGDAIRRILFLSNSVMQDVNGKLRFYCLEQLSPTFDFDGSQKIIEGTFNFKRRDILQSDPITEYEARFNDLDSQYLEEPVDTVSYKVDWLTRKVKENIKVVELYNTNRWQARKILQTRAKLEVGNNLLLEFQGYGATTFKVMQSDLTTITHRKLGGSSKNYLVIEATDSGVSESSRLQKNDGDKRTFRVQEWS